MKKLRTLQFLAALAVSVTAAKAELLTFEDLGSFDELYDGYHGFNWDNLYTYDTTGASPSGYPNGVVSGHNVVFNSGGSDGMVIASSGQFDFNSAYFTAAWNDGLTLQAIGYNGASIVYSNSWTLNTSGPLFINFNYLGVTSVTLHTFGGTNHGYSGNGEHFALDNLTINGSVPDSGMTVLLLGLGLSSLLAFRRRLG
ncbi:MAG TPA: VPDSG-CTERM sorting domain-containing protein [Lacunisphaera sp.]|nr:VPDSG-CTERM sorting domain-containing protein [Lacunisphaera sp.]